MSRFLAAILPALNEHLRRFLLGNNRLEPLHFLNCSGAVQAVACSVNRSVENVPLFDLTYIPHTLYSEWEYKAT
jgi:hypothetical protein